MEHYFGVAKEQGIRNEEIGAVQAIVMAVSAGRIQAQFRQARAAARRSGAGSTEAPAEANE